MTLSKQAAEKIVEKVLDQGLISVGQATALIESSYAPLVGAVKWLTQKCQCRVWDHFENPRLLMAKCIYCGAIVKSRDGEKTRAYIKRRDTLHHETCDYKIYVLDVAASLVEEPCKQ